MTIIKKICDRCEKEVDWLYNVPQFSIQGKRIDIREGCDSDGQLCEDCMWKLIQVIRAFPKGKEMEYLKTEQDILKMLEIIDSVKKSIHHINPITAETIECGSDSLFDTDNLICVSDIGMPINKEDENETE